MLFQDLLVLLIPSVDIRAVLESRDVTFPRIAVKEPVQSGTGIRAVIQRPIGTSCQVLGPFLLGPESYTSQFSAINETDENYNLLKV